MRRSTRLLILRVLTLAYTPSEGITHRHPGHQLLFSYEVDLKELDTVEDSLDFRDVEVGSKDTIDLIFFA